MYRPLIFLPLAVGLFAFPVFLPLKKLLGQDESYLCFETSDGLRTLCVALLIGFVGFLREHSEAEAFPLSTQCMTGISLTWVAGYDDPIV